MASFIIIEVSILSSDAFFVQKVMNSLSANLIRQYCGHRCKAILMKRRDILKSAGCTLFLPALESFGRAQSATAEVDVKRLFCVSMGYGFFTDVLPQTDGADYACSVTTWSL